MTPGYKRRLRNQRLHCKVLVYAEVAQAIVPEARSPSMAVIETTTDRSNLPAAGDWNFDQAHSRVGFVARHLMVTKVRGQFTRFDGTFSVGEDPTQSAVDV